MFYELLQLAIGNLSRARARLAMTAGGVLVGTTAVILLIALTFGLQRAAEAGIGQAGSLTEIQVYPNYGFRPEGGEDSEEEVPELNVEAVRNLWQIEGVQAVIPMVNLQGGELRVGDYTGYAQIMGIDPALLPYLQLTAEFGQLSLNPGEIIVGARSGDYFYDPESEDFEPVEVDLYGEPFTLRLYQYTSTTPQDRDLKLTASAKLAEGSGSFDYALIMPIQDVIKQNEWITGTEIDTDTFRYDQIIVRTSSREVTNEVSDAIRELGFSAGGLGDFLNQLNQFFGTMRLMLGGVGGVALLVAAFGVANTMTMAILERTKEIGLMKAIGATDRDVMTIFLIEAALVGLVGGLSGVGLSLFLQNVINEALRNAPAPNPDGAGGGMMFLPFDTSQIGGNLFVIPPELSLFAVALATLVGVGAGLYPAWRASHLPPVIALKSE
jgi:putative ABC transport system permease protein